MFCGGEKVGAACASTSSLGGKLLKLLGLSLSFSCLGVLGGSLILILATCLWFTAGLLLGVGGGGGGRGVVLGVVVGSGRNLSEGLLKGETGLDLGLPFILLEKFSNKLNVCSTIDLLETSLSSM